MVRGGHRPPSPKYFFYFLAISYVADKTKSIHPAVRPPQSIGPLPFSRVSRSQLALYEQQRSGEERRRARHPAESTRHPPDLASGDEADPATGEAATRKTGAIAASPCAPAPDLAAGNQQQRAGRPGGRRRTTP